MDTANLHDTPKHRQPTSTSHSIWKHETFTAHQNNIVTAVIVEHRTNLDRCVVKRKYGLEHILRYNMVRVKIQVGVNRNYVACLLLPTLLLPLPLLLLPLPLLTTLLHAHSFA